MKHYLVYSIGPVQSFIASARKTEDLWSGSHLLAELSKQAMRVYAPFVTTWVQPGSRPKELSDVADVPNRFSVILEADAKKIIELSKEAEKAIISYLQKIGETSLEMLFQSVPLDTFEQMRKEMERLPEIYWAFRPLPSEESFKDVRGEVEKNLASVKANRSLHILKQSGLTCKLCSERSALSAEHPTVEMTYAELMAQQNRLWSQLREEKNHIVRAGEHLCGVCLTKRMRRTLLRTEFGTQFDSFPSTREFTPNHTEHGYYAVLMMDGDNMGQWIQEGKLTGKVDIASQQELSQRLGRFAEQTVRELMAEKQLRIVYAGGDDVMAFGEITDVLRYATELRRAFGTNEDGLAHGATASAGIVIAHAKAPLQSVLQQVRVMEKTAKAYEDRHQTKDAIGLSLMSHSGQIRQTVLPFKLEQDWTTEWVLELSKLLKTGISFTFLQHFAESMKPLVHELKGEKPFIDHPMVESELTRLVKRASYKLEPENQRQLVQKLTYMYTTLPGQFLEFRQLVEMARFLGEHVEKGVSDATATYNG